MNENVIFNRKIIFAIILFLVPISQASIDIYSPSLPSIVTSLNTHSSSVQLTISLYLFSLGIGQFFYGAISDTIGRKKALFIGMLIFTVTSVICYLANDIYILIAARFFQGLGASSIAVLSKAVSVDLYKGVDLMKASAWVGLIWGVSPIIAPVIGGYLDKIGGWRLPFLVLSFYGFLSCIFVIFFMKETCSSFYKFNLKSLFNDSLKITKNRDFLCSTIIIASTNLGLFVFTLMAPFFLQNILGESQVFYGNMALIIGLTWYCEMDIIWLQTSSKKTSTIIFVFLTQLVIGII